MKITAFTSDPHYGHKNIIEYCKRPFISIYEMERELIERYNSVVGANDTVLWVGDCFFCNKKDAAAIMQRLNGMKLVVVGNHDRGSAAMASLGFSLVMKECLLEVAGVPVRVKHYPYKDDRFPDCCPVEKKGELLIHGHTHSPEKVSGKQIHVGVDAWDYRPAMWVEVEEIVKKIGKKY